MTFEVRVDIDPDMVLVELADTMTLWECIRDWPDMAERKEIMEILEAAEENNE